MNIFSEKLFSKYEGCCLEYVLSEKSHSESVSLIFMHSDEYTSDKDIEKRYTIVQDAPLFSNWLKLFGYEDNEESIFKMMDEASAISEIFHMENLTSYEEIISFLKSENAEIFEKQMTRVYTILESVMDRHPLFGCTFASVYTILSSIHMVIKKQEKAENACKWLLPEFTHLAERLSKQKEVYRACRAYCEAVFQVDNTVGSDVSPQRTASIYDIYCNLSDTDNYMKHPLLDSSPKIITEEDLYGSLVSVPWEAFYHVYMKDHERDEDGLDNTIMHSIEDIAFAGIDFLTETESVLRVCKLCGKMFRVKYTSSQEYCTRMYGDTKTACNEYVSRKAYKEKLFQHPIHQEFTKAYNRLYGRIRRGKIPEDTPLMDQLKKLHEDYYERYENTHKKERERVWREYIEKNRELIG